MNKPILTQINNGILSSDAAMPKKDITSDNTASFELSRKLFNRSFLPNTNFFIPQTGKTVIERHALGINNKVVIDGAKTFAQKKWIGGNRDASSMLTRRKITNTSQINSTKGDKSFKNVKDNNTANDARIRVRSSGYRVPPKITHNYLMIPTPDTSEPYDPNLYFRIVSNGLNAGGAYITAAGSAYGVSAGIYSYRPSNLVGTALTNVALGTSGRSYNVCTILRATGEVTLYSRYDVFGSVAQGNALATFLNSLDSSVIVIVFTWDEPQKSAGGALPAGLVSALKNCGASSSFPTFIRYRSAYILVGIPGIGADNGLEKYKGIADSNATSWLDLRISFADGEYTYISG